MKKVFILADIHSPDVPQLPVGANPVAKMELVGDFMDTAPAVKNSINLNQDIRNSFQDLESLAATVEVSFKNGTPLVSVVSEKRKSGRPKGSKNKVKKIQ